MSNGIRCGCGQCTLGGIFWPVVMITLGVLFFLDRFHLRYGFHELWPVLLIVVGIMKVAAALAPATGHPGQ